MAVVGSVKFAVQFLLALIVPDIVADVPEQVPDQPVKVEPVAETAVRVSAVPEA